MNAIELLDRQHEDIETRWKAPYRELDPVRKRQWFQELADLLAIHATLEEKAFYPAVKREDTQKILMTALEEHLVIKRTLADLLTLPVGDPSFDAKLDLLREEFARHVAEERGKLFPRAREMLNRIALESIGDHMADQARTMEGRAPRLVVLGQALRSPPLDRRALLPDLVRFFQRVWALGATLGSGLAEMVRPRRPRPT